MYLRRKAIVFGVVVSFLGVLGVSRLQAQEQEETWRVQISQVLEIVLDIQSSIQQLADNMISKHDVQALEARIEALERIVIPTPTPTLTPYQEVRNQEEQKLHRDLILFLYEQDKAKFRDDEQFISFEEYIDNTLGLIVILAERCEISVYEMVQLIDLAAKRRDAERGGVPSYHSNGTPYMVRGSMVRPWLFSETKHFCQEE